jgi:hypothetical protein
MRFKLFSVVFTVSFKEVAVLLIKTVLTVSFKEVAVLLIKTVFTVWNSIASMLKWNAFTIGTTKFS